MPEINLTAAILEHLKKSWQFHDKMKVKDIDYLTTFNSLVSLVNMQLQAKIYTFQISHDEVIEKKLYCLTLYM